MDGWGLLLHGVFGGVVGLGFLGGFFHGRGGSGGTVTGSLDEEEFSHAEGAARGLGGGAVVHEGQAFLGHFAEENLPGAADEFFFIDLGSSLRLLGLLAVFAVAVAIAAALAAVAVATFVAAHGFGHSKAGGRGKLGSGVRIFDVGGALLRLLSGLFSRFCGGVFHRFFSGLGGLFFRGGLLGILLFFGLAVVAGAFLAGALFLCSAKMS